MINKSLLVRVFGHTATLFHHDTMVIDRWLWLKKKLPITKDKETLIDIGCGSGAFTIGSAKRGYKSLGLSWDERNQNVAEERSVICNAHNTKYETYDVRKLEDRSDLHEKFNIAICVEVIEHIIDDQKLFREIVKCIKPGGRLLLTAPYYDGSPFVNDDIGPFDQEEEDGNHVRKGYTKGMLLELCNDSNLILEEVSYCSGFFSQIITGFLRFLEVNINPMLAWVIVLPLRIIPLIFDKPISKIFNWSGYSICMEAYKPKQQ